jgi:transcriptional regulator with XRE-family HTH domain
MDINNIKKIRQMYGATQEEVAKAIKINRSTISQCENGVIKASSASLEKLAMFYGISPNSFYEISDIEDIRKDISIKKAQNNKSKMANPALYKKETIKKYKDGELIKETTTEYYRRKMYLKRKLKVAASH